MTRSMRSILGRLRTLEKRVSALRALHPDHDPVTMAALGQMSDEQLHLLERVASDRAAGIVRELSASEAEAVAACEAAIEASRSALQPSNQQRRRPRSRVC
jgi:Mg/Co/Ni transporter MgtE